MENNDDEIDLGQLVRTIWRGKWLIGALLVVFGMLGFLYATKIAEPAYVASATVLLESNNPQVASLGAPAVSASQLQMSPKTEIFRIRSRQLLRRLVIEQNLTNDPEFNPLLAEVSPFSINGFRNMALGAPEPRVYSDEDLIRIAVNRLRSRVSVTNPRQSMLVEIGVTTGSSEKSTALANALALTYINGQQLLKEEQTAEAIESLEAITAELRNELYDTEIDVKDFVAGFEFVSQEDLIAKNRQVKDLRDRLAALEAVIERRQALADLYLSFDIDQATAAEVALFDSRVLDRLFQTIAQNDSNRARFTDAFATERNRNQSALVQSQAQKSVLETAISDLEGQIAKEPNDLLTLQRLQRESEATWEVYGYFLARLSEFEFQRYTQRADAQLLSSAVKPTLASGPSARFITFMAGILGAILGAVIVLFREQIKGGVRT